MTSPCVITIDGPSGAGKGTLSLLTARKLGYQLLDSGALYRLVALAAMNQGLALDDEPALAQCARQLDVHFDTGRDAVQIQLAGKDVTQAIRSETVSMGASRVAALPQVREALLDRQRAFRVAPGLVADGRDMGTVVFPDAQVKIFLTASPEARAKRRYLQLTAKGEVVDMDALIKDIEARDARDSQRAVAPLRPAADALLIDSTDLSIDQVLECILSQINQLRI